MGLVVEHDGIVRSGLQRLREYPRGGAEGGVVQLPERGLAEVLGGEDEHGVGEGDHLPRGGLP